MGIAPNIATTPAKLEATFDTYSDLLLVIFFFSCLYNRY